MKNLTIVSTVKGGIKFTQMPKSYLLTIEESDDVLFINFMDGTTHEVLHTILIPVDDRDEPRRDFLNYTGKGQHTLLTLMRNHIKEDMLQFLSEEKDEEYYTIYPLDHRGIFVSEEFEQRWRDFYDFIIDTEVLSDEYVAPQKTKE